MTVDDVGFGDDREMFVVRPAAPKGPGIMWLHWFDEAPNANRGQFLAEAVTLAEAGVSSVLPQLVFPWSRAPEQLSADHAAIESEKAALHRVYETLAGMEGVTADRVAIVGHDFGAMHGMTLFGEVELGAAVLVAPTPRWADWFLRFWPITTDRFDYMRGLERVDPITMARKASSPTLFQFGKVDFYIAGMTGLELFNATSEPKELKSYDSGHEMDSEAIVTDRHEFLARHLGLGESLS